MIPGSGETSSNVFYRIHLIVQDSSGQTFEPVRDLLPVTVTIDLQSTPSGAQLLLDGQPLAAKFSFVGVAGIKRTIGVPSPQNIRNKSYTFQSWSDGGAATHMITTPTSNATYRARLK